MAACGDNEHGECDVLALERGLTYTSVAAGGGHAVLLRSNDTMAAFGDNDYSTSATCRRYREA